MKHSDSAEFQCPNCLLKFPSKHNLKQHMLIHIEKAFKCGLCDAAFRYFTQLRMHVHIHTMDENLEFKTEDDKTKQIHKETFRTNKE